MRVTEWGCGSAIGKLGKQPVGEASRGTADLAVAREKPRDTTPMDAVKKSTAWRAWQWRRNRNRRDWFGFAMTQSGTAPGSNEHVDIWVRKVAKSEPANVALFSNIGDCDAGSNKGIFAFSRFEDRGWGE